MSTAETQTPGSSSTRRRSHITRNIVVGLFCLLLVGFLAVMGTSLMAAQKTENLRREVGRAGGQCEFENRIPAWLQAIGGTDFHTSMDYPVIVGVTMTGEELDNSNLARLPAMPELQSLDLQNTQVTSEGLSHLSKWKNLRQLNLTNTPVTDITPLAELPRLTALQLNFSQVRGEHLSGLSGLDSLSILGAGYLQVTDAEVVKIAQCPNLEALSVAASNLGEHGLQPLESLEHLKSLVLIDAKYDRADLEEFRAKRPDVEIVN